MTLGPTVQPKNFSIRMVATGKLYYRRGQGFDVLALRDVECGCAAEGMEAAGGVSGVFPVDHGDASPAEEFQDGRW